MEVLKIEKLDEILRNYLGDEKSVVDHETRRLTEIGDNFGSEILAVKIHVKNKNQTEILEAVAKLPPPGELFRRMFNTPVTFKGEIGFYQKILPELSAFVHDKGLDGFIDYVPKFLGARMSLQPNSSEVDDGAVLLLENLKVQGYEMVDRTVGFDYETSKSLIKTLAKYHSVPLALKTLKPEFFLKKLRPLFQPYKVFDFDAAMYDLVVTKIQKIVEEIDSCKPHVQKVVDAFKATPPLLKNSSELVREPFATIIHTDAWVNNFMLQYQDGVPVGSKLVDFQLCEYASPLRDVIFFIFTSVQIPVVREHFDGLIELYHQTLVDGLVGFGCDPSPFSLEEVHNEMKLVVKEYEFVHCVMMLEPVYAVKEDLKELDQYDEKDFTVTKAVPPKHKERVEFIVQESVKRKWI